MIASSTLRGTEKERAQRHTILDAICVAVLIAYFVYFALPALRGGFREDEMMNMGICWCAGALKSLLANIVFWKPFLCPGKRPLRSASLSLSPGRGSLLPAALSFLWPGSLALPDCPDQHSRCVHSPGFLLESAPRLFALDRLSRCACSLLPPAPGRLVFVGAFIYDVLCGFFYFAALGTTSMSASKTFLFDPAQLLGFLALYICALNCKEMAVTLPVIVLIYEFLKSSGWPDWNGFLRWIRSYAVPSLIAGLLTVFYIYGKPTAAARWQV